MRPFGKKALEIGVATILGIVLLGSGFWLGWGAGRRYPTNITVTGIANVGVPSSTGVSAADFSAFWEAWQLINDDYLNNPSTTNQEKVYGAINGLVDSLNDPYSEFFNPQDNQQFQQDITGDFGGIGAELGADTNGNIVIVAPLKGTPAEQAGLKPKDWIVGINGTSTDGMTVDQAVDLIRGPEGTKVTLSILRAGWSAPKDFTIMRAIIQVPNVDFEMLPGGIAHITLNEFTQDADTAFYQSLVKALSDNTTGIVLDLRDDPGGYLEVAVDIAGYFLKPGTLIVKEVGRAVPEQDFTAQGNGALANFPMVVLVNGGSASAAEILAGALRDDRAIPLVGEKTFGKGTVQELEPLPDGSAIKLTVAHWVLPSGRILDHDGLEPDYNVTSTASTTSGEDPQLVKAVQVLQTEIH